MLYGMARRHTEPATTTPASNIGTETHGRVACIGECMIELSEQADGCLTRSYGGDTLNTAVYLARLGSAVDYVTALGDDRWSDEMLAAWQAEGIGTGHGAAPARPPAGALPHPDRCRAANGASHYWRDSAAARALFALQETPAICEALARLRPALPVRHHAVALWRGRPASGFSMRWTGAGRRRPRRLRHQFPGARLARPGRWRRPLPRGSRPLRHRACLDRGSGPAFRRARPRSSSNASASAEVVLKLPTPACRVSDRGMDDWSRRGR